jgi:DNA-binding NarL/FixJ family response regulator
MLVDDHAIWRGGVKSMLADTEFVVVGEAASGKEALEVARQVKPRLALLDIRMVGGDGLDALVALKHEHPRMTVVMLTTYDNPTFRASAVAGGATGYLLKGVPREELLNTLREVANGENLLTAQDLVSSLRGISEAANTSGDLFQPLTRREQEVLGLVATGLCNRDIGAILFIAEGTVKSHVEHILGKLNVSDRVQAAVWAVRQGLVSLPE